MAELKNNRNRDTLEATQLSPEAYFSFYTPPEGSAGRPQTRCAGSTPDYRDINLLRRILIQYFPVPVVQISVLQRMIDRS
jgi:hypothetical protein